MPKMLKDASLYSVMQRILYQDLRLPFKEKVIKNSPVTVGVYPGFDKRVSYKYYVYRYDQIIEASEQYGQAFQYDSTSIHFKDLQSFDDLIKKVAYENNNWLKIAKTERA